MAEYEYGGGGEHGPGWRIVILICAALLAWGAIQYAIIPDTARRWDFGALPDAPSQSVYTASQPANPQGAPPQIEPLPEARRRQGAAGQTPTGEEWRPPAAPATSQPSSGPAGQDPEARP